MVLTLNFDWMSNSRSWLNSILMQLYSFYNVVTLLCNWNEVFPHCLAPYFMFLSLSCVNNEPQPWPHIATQIQSHTFVFCSISAASKSFCSVDPFFRTVGICGYLTCIGLSGQGKGNSCSLKLERDGPLLSANASYQASAADCRLLCGSGCFGLLIRLFVCFQVLQKGSLWEVDRAASLQYGAETVCWHHCHSW